MSRSALWFPREWIQWVARSRKPISGLSVCLRATAARSTAVWILEAAWSAALDRPVSCCLSTFPLRFPAPNNHDGNVPGCRLKATHELEGGRKGGGGVYLEASMEFHREKHLVPFLWAGSNVRRQNAAQWVNLQLSSSPPRPLVQTSAYTHKFTIISGRAGPAAFSCFPRGGGGIVSLTPRVLCLHHFAQHALPPAPPPVEFSITSHVRDTLRSGPRWRLQQELLRRHLSTVPTPAFEGLFLHRSARGLNQQLPLRLFGETVASKELRVGSANTRARNSCGSAARPVHWSRPRVTALLYPLNVQPQTAAPPLEGTRSHDLSPFYSTVYLWSCRGSKSPECVGSERNCDATSLHKDPLRSSRNPAAADFPEEMKLPLSRGYSFLEKSPR